MLLGIRLPGRRHGEHRGFCRGRKVHYQGVVKGQVSENLFLVAWFSWMHGGETWESIVSLDDMRRWQFFESDEWMRNWLEYNQ